MRPVLHYDDYTIAWLAVLPIEAEAALGMLDKLHDGQFESVRGDDYVYIGGEINRHKVVIATWPAGQNYGTVSAASLVNQVKARFSNIWFALLVGVAAGLPNLSTTDSAKRRDIRLGDVLVCVPEKASSGIIHYDLGKDTEAGFVLNGRQAETPAIVRAAIGNIQLLKKKPFRVGNEFAEQLALFQNTVDDIKFRCRNQDEDKLFKGSEEIKRELRDELDRTQVWYGNIGSGSSMMRNPRRRDELRDEHDLIGLEMEASGIMNALPTGVIRGVCDYGDGQKNKDWQPYAAAVAAVYARGILYTINPKVNSKVILARSGWEDIETDSRQLRNTGDESSLVELWPATPPGEIEKIFTTADIVAIHGFGENSYVTWTSGSRLWLRDFFPSIIPEARISTFGYNSVLAFEGDASGIHTCAVQLLEAIRKMRRLDRDPNRKLFFICHSLGGLLFKKALFIAQEQYQRYSSISQSTAGVIFMGTPHHGRGVSDWTRILRRLEMITPNSSGNALLQTLQLKSETLGEICSRFAKISKSLQIFTAVETLKVDKIDDLVVNEESAVLRLPNETCIKLQANHVNLCKFASPSNEAYGIILSSMLELIDSAEMPATIDGLTSFQAKFLEELPETNPESMIERVPAPHYDSCQWINANQAFLSWKKSLSCRLLWILGAPGAGKTVMVKHIVNHLRSSTEFDLQKLGTLSGSATTQFFIFFFCDDKDPVRRTSRSLIRSVLYQIIHRDRNFHLFRYIDELVSKPKGPSQETSIIEDLEMLWRCLALITQKSRGATFWIVIDAIDELEQKSRKHTLLEIESIIRGDPVGHVKVLLTGRDVPKGKLAESVVLKAKHIHMDNIDVHKDVQRFIDMEIETLFDDAAISMQLRDKVETGLKHVSSGTFLHASLALANFSSGVKSWTPAVIRERLLSLENQPTGLESFYCGLLRRIPPQFKGQARQIFAWTLASYEPFTLEQLQCAITLNEQHQSFSHVCEDMSYNFTEKFSEHCGYLLMVDRNGLVRFTHQSVKDLLLGQTFLPANEEILRFFRMRPEKIHFNLASKCLMMLQLHDFSRASIHRNLISQKNLHTIFKGEQGAQAIIDVKSRLSKYLILDYSMRSWSRHAAQVADDVSVVSMVSSFIMHPNAEYFRLLSSPWMEPARQIFPWLKFQDVLAFEPPFHRLLQLGDFPGAIQELINRGQDVNELDANGISPLQWTVVKERTRSFELLMQHTTTDPNRGNPSADKAIHQSIYWHRSEMLRKLLNDQRVNVNVRGRRDETPLHMALEYSSSGAADMLLALKGESIDFLALDSENQTPLERAFRYGHSEAIVTKIIRSVNIKNAIKTSNSGVTNHLLLAGIFGWTEIEHAILRDDPEQVLYLDDEGMNVLTRYAYYGRKSKVAMLLRYLPASAINSSTTWGRYNLLHLCAQQDWEDIFDFFRKKFGQQELGCDHRGRSVMHWAVEYGWAYSCSYQFGREKSLINKQDHDGLTAIHLAVLARNEQSLRILLDRRADYLLKDKYGKTPVHIAAETGYRIAVELFLDTPTREFGRDRQGASLLHYLVMWLPGEVVINFIDSKVPILNVRDRLRRTPLHYAATFNNIEAAAALLSKGAAVGLKDHYLQTPLHYAIREGHLDIVKLLTDNGARLSEPDGFMQTCVQISIRSGDIATIEFMLQMEPLIHNRDKFGLTPLHRACAFGNADIVEKLINLGADCNAKDKLSYTPLHLSVAHQHCSVTRLLLKVRDLKLSEKDYLNCTPLDRALVEGDAQISNLLIDFGAQSTNEYRSKLKHCIPYQGTFHKLSWHDWPVVLYKDLDLYPPPRPRRRTKSITSESDIKVPT